MKKVTVEALRAGREKLLENAIELIEEANILLDNNKFSRTYTLSHLAWEELSKIPVLNTIEIELALGNEINWKSINRRLYNHKSKIRAAILFEYIFDNEDPNRGFLDVFRTASNFNWLKT